MRSVSSRWLALLFLSFLAAVAAAKEADQNIAAEKTTSIGLKLVRIPAGEFMMGGAEPAEELVKAFSTYKRPPEYFKDEYPRHRVKITKPFYLGQVRSDRRRVQKIRRRDRLQNPARNQRRRRHVQRRGRLGLQRRDRQDGRPRSEIQLAQSRLRADRRSARARRHLVRRRRVLQMARQEGRQDRPPADRGRMGIRLPGGHGHPLQHGRAIRPRSRKTPT